MSVETNEHHSRRQARADKPQRARNSLAKSDPSRYPGEISDGLSDDGEVLACLLQLAL
jgi:hypothetical protein